MPNVRQIAQDIVAREGGYVNDPADPGGPTQYGVTLGPLRALARDVNADGVVDVADVRVKERSARSVEEAQRIRETEMARVDPDEKSRIAAAAAAYEQRERQRQLRMAATDTAMDSWAKAMRGRLAVTDA